MISADICWQHGQSFLFNRPSIQTSISQIWQIGGAIMEASHFIENGMAYCGIIFLMFYFLNFDFNIVTFAFKTYFDELTNSNLLDTSIHLLNQNLSEIQLCINFVILYILKSGYNVVKTS